ncbi:MAG: SAM-dependent methyltransferase [Clostridia bacterium]|nr:SAM-dependent methyltransferase [Clostridia bacterium]
MKKPALDARLRAAAAYVRQDAVFADVGTDHAYLPLFLLAEGRILRAVLSDINEGPLARAREHAATYPYGDKLSFHLTNGLEGLSEQGITDIAICGMGGELIADILSRAPFVKDPKIRLILQPMSRPAKLRAHLAAEGFSILSETYVSAAGKHYACMHAAFSGAPYALSPFEEEFGQYPDTENKAFLAYLFSKERALCAAVRGMQNGGGEAAAQKALLAEIEDFKKKHGLEHTL